MSDLLRPTTSVVGNVVTTIATKYDMRDQGGQAGISYRLWCIVVDPETGEHKSVNGFKVPAELVPATSKLSMGEPVRVDLIGFTQVRGGRAVIEWQIHRLLNAKGEVLAERLRAA